VHYDALHVDVMQAPDGGTCSRHAEAFGEFALVDAEVAAEFSESGGDDLSQGFLAVLGDSCGANRIVVDRFGELVEVLGRQVGPLLSTVVRCSS